MCIHTGAGGELEHNPLYAANMMHWIAAAHFVDYPLSVTEWNVEPFPVPDRHVIPLYIASSASLQGWNALMQYAYSEEPLVGLRRPWNSVQRSGAYCHLTGGRAQ